MPDENLHILMILIFMLNRAQWYAQLFEAYAWHFRIKNRPATHEELSRFAQWQGLQTKEPSKKEIIDFFLQNKIIF